MAERAQYVETICSIDDTDGTMKALDGVSVNVTMRGTTVPATLYLYRDQLDLSPASFETVKGRIEFWADPGAYDIHLEDTEDPKRIEDTVIGWDSVSGEEGGMPGDRVETGTITRAHLDSIVQNALHPIGEVIEWWRPNGATDGTFAPPPGFVPMEGQTIPAGQHEFTAGLNGDGSLTLPDARNKFSLGADRTKGGGAASATGDAVANSPGIGGPGGSNTIRTTMPAHYHGKGNLGIYDPGHQHNNYASDDASNPDGKCYKTGNLAASFTASGHIHTASTGVDLSGSYVGNNGGSNGDAAYTVDVRPQHIGFLKMVKVRYA